jgi:hypothetical protein
MTVWGMESEGPQRLDVGVNGGETSGHSDSNARRCGFDSHGPLHVMHLAMRIRSVME